MHKINTFDYLSQFEKIHVKINDCFFDRLKTRIAKEHGIKKFASFLETNSNTFLSEFRRNKYHPFYRILKVIEILNITKEELYNNILGFYHWGSHDKSPLQVPMKLEIDEFFVEGYTLYLAEGTNGSNGKTRPRKFKFTNSNVAVINHMIKWVNKYFSELPSYVLAYIPSENENLYCDKSQINHTAIKLVKGYYNKIIKYNLLCERAVLIDLLLSIEEKVKELSSKNSKLAAAYIRGMMIGEGTAYFNRSRYVRIEMRNEKEIKYLHKLLIMLGYNCTPTLRSNRCDMWSLYIGAKQLDKFAREIGFGVHNERQRILEDANKKILRVNQYC